MRRREAIAGMGAALLAACAPAARSDPEASLPAVATKGPAATPGFSALTSPLFDIHAHPSSTRVVDLAPAFRDPGVNAAGAVLMGGSPAQVELELKAGGYLVAFYTPNARAPYDAAAVERVLTQNAAYRGIGELIARHSSMGVARPADDPGLNAIVALAGRLRIPVNVHHEPSLAPGGVTEGAAEMGRLLEKNPATTVIWAHGAASGPPTIMPMLDRYPNLYIDLANRWKPGAPSGWFDDENGTLKSFVAALWERFPLRFLFGSDLVPDSPGASPIGPNMAELPEHVAHHRRLLAQLTPPTAEKIGVLNAKRILGLP